MNPHETPESKGARLRTMYLANLVRAAVHNKKIPPPPMGKVSRGRPRENRIHEHFSL